MSKEEKSKREQFIHCPMCESTKMEVTDYENEGGEEDTDGRRCSKCDWEGDVSELVSLE